MHNVYSYLYMKVDKKSPIRTLHNFIDDYLNTHFDLFDIADKGWVNDREFILVVKFNYSSIDRLDNLKDRFALSIKDNFPDIAASFKMGDVIRETRKKPIGDYTTLNIIKLFEISPFENGIIATQYINSDGEIDDPNKMDISNHRDILKKINSIKKGNKNV